MKSVLFIVCLFSAQLSFAKTATKAAKTAPKAAAATSAAPAAAPSAPVSAPETHTADVQTSTQVGELYFQPDAGQQSIDVGAHFSELHIKTANGSGKIKVNGAEAVYQYGLTQYQALGVDLSYASTKSDGDPSYSGLEDITFRFRGMYPLEVGRLRYGTELQWSPENSKSDASGNTTNQFSGGNTLVPYVGYEINITPQDAIGLSLSKEFLIGKRTEDANGTKFKATGGEDTTLKAYYEHFIEKNVLGASLDYVQTSDTKVGTSHSEGLNNWVLGLYSRWLVADNLSIIPKISYGEALNSSINNVKIDKIYVTDFFIAARYSF